MPEGCRQIRVGDEIERRVDVLLYEPLLSDWLVPQLDQFLRSVASASTVTVDGTFSRSVDWAVVALEIRTSASSPTQHTLTTNVIGSGSVDLSPPGGTYAQGTGVSLTAQPSSGFEFSGWSGDLNGTLNPTTLTMDSDKNVTATFRALPPGQVTLTVNVFGSGSVSLSPAVHSASRALRVLTSSASGDLSSIGVSRLNT